MFFYMVLRPIFTTSGLKGSGNTRKYHQIDVYIYQCVFMGHGQNQTPHNVASDQILYFLLTEYLLLNLNIYIFQASI